MSHLSNFFVSSMKSLCGVITFFSQFTGVLVVILSKLPLHQPMLLRHPYIIAKKMQQGIFAHDAGDYPVAVMVFKVLLIQVCGEYG